MRMSMMAPLVFDVIMRILGPILVIFVWILLGFFFYVYFMHVVPASSWNLLQFPANIITVIGLVIIFNTYYNHIRAVFTTSGKIPDSQPVVSDMERLLYEESSSRRGEGFSKICRTCKKFKPIRAHHCHVCGRCVLKMDHHCPWLGNCVGYYNYRYFFLFLLWLTIACIYFTSVSFPIIAIYKDVPDFRAHEGSILICFIIAVSASIAVGGLWGFHLYLTLTNQSTIEMYYNRYQQGLAKKRGEVWVNPFDVGWRRNFHLSIGSGKYMWSWMFPGITLPGDGIIYPQVHQTNLESVAVVSQANLDQVKSDDD